MAAGVEVADEAAQIPGGSGERTLAQPAARTLEVDASRSRRAGFQPNGPVFFCDNDWRDCQTRTPVEKPRIYGSEARFRAAVARSIRSGEDLLAQTAGARNRMSLAGSRENAFVIEQEWEGEFRRWFNRTANALAQYLQEQLVGIPRGLRADTDSGGEDLLPVLGAGLPPDDGKPRHAIGIDNGEAWLSKTLDELRELESALGPPNATAAGHARRSSAPFFGRPIWLAVGAAGAVASIIALVLAIFWH